MLPISTSKSECCQQSDTTDSSKHYICMEYKICFHYSEEESMVSNWPAKSYSAIVCLNEADTGLYTTQTH